MVTEKPWHWEDALQLLLRLFLCVVLGALLAPLGRSFLGGQPAAATMVNLVIFTVCFQGGGLVAVAAMLRECRVSWAAAFGFPVGWQRAIGLGILAGVVVTLITWSLQWLSVATLKALHMATPEQDAVRLLRETHSLAQQGYIAVSAIVFAPVVEEILFRGVLYPLIKQSGWPRLALWGTAVLFAAVHANVAIFGPLVFLAVALTLLYEWTGNLLTGMIVHSLFNAANFALMFVVDPN